MNDFWRKNIEAGTCPSSDITHGTKKVSINFYLPGIKRKNIMLLVDENKVTLEAYLKKKRRAKEGATTKIEKFYREISLPAGLNSEKSRQYWRNNMLTVEIPKKRKS